MTKKERVDLVEKVYDQIGFENFFGAVAKMMQLKAQHLLSNRQDKEGYELCMVMADKINTILDCGYNEKDLEEAGIEPDEDPPEDE